jgi:SRSO17 transposase
MTKDQILSLGPELVTFLHEFHDCFGRSEPRTHLADYVRGQLSDLPRKSVEPIADFVGKPPRTLQEFLRVDDWDHEMLRDRVQQLVMRDHADDEAIAILDDSGHPKKGKHTAAVAPQYCGRTGKVDNCVVSVHLSYASFDTRFRVMLDSTLFLPEHWTNDATRRKKAGIPDDVVYRPKYEIGLEQVDRARSNGVRFGWITADIWYSQKPKFLAGLEQRRLRYVVETPRNLQGWTYNPASNPQCRPSPVENLCHFSRHMLRQPWTQFRIKNTEKGPMVWEVKACAFWLWRDEQVLGPYWLIYARDVLDATQEKYFLSNAAPGTPLSVLLHVGFARWPLERCLEDKKSELGLSHFEVRNYQSIHRHFYLTQVSHLFAAQQTGRLRGEKSGDNHLPGTRRGQRADRRPVSLTQGPRRPLGEGDPEVRTHTTEERPSKAFPYQDTKRKVETTQHRCRKTQKLYTTLALS